MSHSDSPKTPPVFAILAGLIVLLLAAMFLFNQFVLQPAQQSDETSQGPAVVDEEIMPTGDRPLIDLALETGVVTIELRPDLAPKHVEQITALTQEGFYDGIVFHRVIEGFMAQTGDPTGTGMGGSERPDIPAEFSDESFVRGTVGMARSQSPDSANSQFFIMFAPAPHLDGGYTIVGQVLKGMELIDALPKGDPRSGLVPEPDKIVTMKIVEADADH